MVFHNYHGFWTISYSILAEMHVYIKQWKEVDQKAHPVLTQNNLHKHILAKTLDHYIVCQTNEKQPLILCRKTGMFQPTCTLHKWSQSALKHSIKDPWTYMYALYILIPAHMHCHPKLSLCALWVTHCTMPRYQLGE